MRIGIFTDTYPPFINGVSTSIVNLEKALRAKGHQVFIVTVNPDDMSYQFDEGENIIRIPGIPIGIYDYRLTGIYPLRAINKVKNWHLDIIHSHTEFGIGTFARIIAKQLGIPLVHTYHTMYEDYTHYITKGHFDKSSKKLVEYFTTFYCDKTCKELIVPSKKTYTMFKEKYHVEKNVHIVPTGIEIERFFKDNFPENTVKALKKELGLKEDDFIILYVGRLAKEKNMELLLRAQVEIVKKNKRAKLVIIGSGPDYEHFIEMSKQFKIQNSVLFTNAIPWVEMPNYYQLADVFVTASKTETQGLTIVEAMSASVPIVCLNDEAFNSVVVDDLNGYLFDTEEEYIEKITYLMKQPEKLQQMGKQARYTAEQYSLKYYAENILDVYNTCLKNEKQAQKRSWIDKLKSKLEELKKD